MQKTAGILLSVEHPGQFHAIPDYSYPQPPQAFVDQNMSTPPASSYNATLAAANWIQHDYHHPVWPSLPIRVRIFCVAPSGHLPAIGPPPYGHFSPWSIQRVDHYLCGSAGGPGPHHPHVRLQRVVTNDHTPGAASAFEHLPLGIASGHLPPGLHLRGPSTGSRPAIQRVLDLRNMTTPHSHDHWCSPGHDHQCSLRPTLRGDSHSCSGIRAPMEQPAAPPKESPTAPPTAQPTAPPAHVQSPTPSTAHLFSGCVHATTM